MNNANHPGMTPHTPQRRTLLWTDEVLDIQDLVLDLGITAPLYLVGGAVRDAFLSRLTPSSDLDLTTPTDSIAIAKQITNALDADIFIMDDERGVARILIDDPQVDTGQRRIDIANFRGDDLLADLLDRDFTVNAMAVDLKDDLQLLIDPLNGEADAELGRIRRCNETAISDDPIRMLRAVRQSIQLGFRIDPQTLADIRTYTDTLYTTSEERVRDEFFNILSLDTARQGVRVLQAVGLLEQIIPQAGTLQAHNMPDNRTAWEYTAHALNNIQRILQAMSYRRTDSTAANFDLGMVAMQFDRFRSQLNAHFAQHWSGERKHASLMNLGALLHLIPHSTMIDGDTLARQTANRLRLSNSEKKRLQTMLNFYEVTQTIDHTDPLTLHRFWHPLKESGIDAVFLGLAAYRAAAGNRLNQDDWLLQVERGLMLLHTYFNEYDTIVDPPLLLDGNDLITEFDIQGRIIGQTLDYLREQQVTDAITSRDDALQAAAAFIEGQQA